jgi:hypothetical protein
MNPRNRHWHSSHSLHIKLPGIIHYVFIPACLNFQSAYINIVFDLSEIPADCINQEMNRHDKVSITYTRFEVLYTTCFPFINQNRPLESWICKKVFDDAFFVETKNNHQQKQKK